MKFFAKICWFVDFNNLQMVLVAISQKFILNFQPNFSKKVKRSICSLPSFWILINSYLGRLRKVFFLVKVKVIFATFQQTFAKLPPLIFFHSKLPSL